MPRRDFGLSWYLEKKLGTTPSNLLPQPGPDSLCCDQLAFQSHVLRSTWVLLCPPLIFRNVEKYFYSCWPPDETRENILIEAVIFTINKIMNCTTCCMICDNPLPFSMLKPSICDSSLCAFRYSIDLPPQNTNPSCDFCSF